MYRLFEEHDAYVLTPGEQKDGVSGPIFITFDGHQFWIEETKFMPCADGYSGYFNCKYPAYR